MLLYIIIIVIEFKVIFPSNFDMEEVLQNHNWHLGKIQVTLNTFIDSVHLYLLATLNRRCFLCIFGTFFLSYLEQQYPVRSRTHCLDDWADWLTLPVLLDHWWMIRSALGTARWWYCSLTRSDRIKMISEYSIAIHHLRVFVIIFYIVCGRLECGEKTRCDTVSPSMESSSRELKFDADLLTSALNYMEIKCRKRHLMDGTSISCRLGHVAAPPSTRFGRGRVRAPNL